MSNSHQDWYIDYNPNAIMADTEWVFNNVTVSDILALPTSRLGLLAFKEIMRDPYGEKANFYAKFLRKHLDKMNKPFNDAIDRAIMNMSSGRMT